MPTIISHGLSACLLGKTMLMRKAPWGLWYWSAVCAMLPDADVIGFLFGVEYGDFWGHRGFSHSILFAILCAIVIVAVFRKPLFKIRMGYLFWSFYFSLIIASHGFFDALTNGGLGIAFFAPFDNARYFLPWRPVQVSPIGLYGFISERGARLFLSEFTYILLPLLPLLGLRFLHKKSRRRQA